MNKLFFSTFSFLALSFFSIASLQAHEETHKTHCCKVYGGFYTKDCSEISPGEAIAFDHNMDDIEPSAGIIHARGSCEIILRNPGIYRITYSLSLKDKGKVALTLDGNLINGTEMFIGSNEHLSTSSSLVKIHPSHHGQILKLINHNDSGSWFDQCIKLKAGYDHQNITASILIEKIANLPKCCHSDKKDPCGNDPCCKELCEDTQSCHHSD